MKFRIRYALFTLCLCLCLFSGWKLYHIYAAYQQGEERYEDVTAQFVSPMAAPSVSGGAPRPESPGGETSSGEASIPAGGAETVPITVDFAALRESCPDVVGWIYCPDTPIHYPIVQGQDNRYYLDRLMDSSYNSSGSIFMDYRSRPDFSGWNTILYGHNMKNDSMFGTLEEYKAPEYYEAHPVLYLLTPAQDYKIALIGGYTTSGTSKGTYAFPDTQAGRDQVATKAAEASTFHAETQVQDVERLITLSTCAYDYDGARYVLVGVLKPLAKLQTDKEAAGRS